MKKHEFKVLIVDDEAALVDIYSTKFKSEGFYVCTANDGCAALQQIVVEWPNIVLLDIVMPERAGIYDGFDVLHRIRDDVRMCDIPVVIMSNLGMSQDVKRGKEMGAVEYIVKSEMTPSEVVMIVKKVLDI